MLIYGVEYDVVASIGAGSTIVVAVIHLIPWAVAHLEEPPEHGAEPVTEQVLFSFRRS